jgi:flavoprotein
VATSLWKGKGDGVTESGYFGRGDKLICKKCSENRVTKAMNALNKFVITTRVATLCDAIALSFVIPSEAEGSAVPRILRGNVLICGFFWFVNITGVGRMKC